MYKKTSILIVCLLLMYGAKAQSTKKLSVSEAIELGVTNSKTLALSESKVKEAQAKVAQARDKFWPEVGVSASYLHINTPSIKQSGESSGSSGSSPLAALSNIHNIGLAQASLSLPLFSGFQIRNNKQMADYLEQAATYDVQTEKSKVKVNTVKAFAQYYELLQTKSVLEENLKQKQQQLAELKNKEAQKLITRNDLLKAELQASNVELMLTDVNNNIQLANYNLVLLLGLSAETIIEVDTTNLFTIASVTNWADLLQKGLDNRSEIKSVSYQLKANESGYKVAKASRYPSLALTGGYINAYIPNFITVTNALNAGVSFKYSITGAIHSNHKMQEASARSKQAEASQQLITDQVSMEIRQKYLNYQQSLEKIKIYERSVEQAKENFQINENKYKQGLALLSDYQDADVLLLQAQINYSTGKADSMIAYYELQESTGNLQ